MINNKADYLFYLESDRIAKAIPRKTSINKRIKELFFPNYIWIFQKRLRKLEYYKNCKHGFVASLYFLILFMRFKKLSYKLGFSIPLNVFGPGLSIAHHGNIVVNSAARIGANCRIHVGVNIGTEAGFGSQAPLIGDNCYIGPGVKIFGPVRIADNVAIGANAVVNKSIEESNIAIGGIPAKKIADTDLFKILIPGSIIVEKGMSSEVEKIIVRSDNLMTADIYNLITQSKL